LLLLLLFVVAASSYCFTPERKLPTFSNYCVLGVPASTVVAVVV